jgi:amino acid adenylation domain-containing protein
VSIDDEKQLSECSDFSLTRQNRDRQFDVSAINLVEAPLAPGQERFWLSEQIFPDSVAYQTQRHIRIKGKLNVEILEHALDRLLGRHKIFHTQFQSKADRLLQRIVPNESIQLEMSDLSSLDPEAQRQEIEQLAKKHTQQKLSLEKPILFRMRLLRLSAEEHILLFAVHHIIFDGWSFEIFKRDLLTLYQACLANTAPELPELPLQYIDYANSYSKRHQDAKFQQQIEYWCAKLSGITSETKLPRLESPEHHMDGEGRAHLELLSSEQTKKLEQFCIVQGCTPYMLFVTACCVLFFHYGNRDETVLGCPVAGRSDSEIENLIGCFINMLSIRVVLKDDLTVKQLVAQVRDTVLEALSNQEVSFHHVVQAVQPAKAFARPPIFQVMVHYRNFPRLESEFTPLEIQQFKTDYEAAPIDLSFEWEKHDDHLSCALVYDVSLFAPKMVSQIARQYMIILERIMADVEQSIAALSPLSHIDRNTLLHTWNDTQYEFPKATSLELIRQQADSSPDKSALEYKQQQITYGQLQDRSNQYAHWLKAKGVLPNDRVVLGLSRSPEVVIAILGVMKAGAAYVYLDQSNSIIQNQHILDDIQPRCVLIDSGTFRNTFTNHTLYDIREQCQEIDSCSTQNPSVEVHPGQLAYIMYTSGSTGAPKGVPIKHQSLSNYVYAFGNISGIQPSDRHLQFASLAFDFSVEDIFVTLGSGATLVLRTEDMIDPDRLLERITDMEISRLSLPTAFFSVLTERLDAQPLAPSLHTVMIGGEALKSEYLKLWHAATKGKVRLLNNYGPTETTITSTWIDLQEQMASVPIGKPIANYRHYVLDPLGYLTPIGVEGELYIAGIGLSPGYWNADEETQRRFVGADQLPDVPNSEGRVYKTGDRVRYDFDGNLYFLGRYDRQVKLKGFRVELDAIEHVLRQYPDITDAVADVLPGSDTLVAWFLTRTTNKKDTKALLQFVSRQLPAYMTPTQLVQVDEWPQTSRGKVAVESLRRNLPAKDQHFEAPETTTEKWVAKIWEQIMQVEEIGRNDSFFALGGNSIQAMQIINRIGQSIQQSLPMSLLFNAATLREFSELLERSELDSSFGKTSD